MMINFFSALVLDFNGVLFWDDDLQRQSWREFATRLRKAPLTDAEIDIHIHGRNNQHTIEYLLGHATTQIEADDLSEQKEVIYREMCLAMGDGFRLSSGATDLLDGLVANQIPRTIATASGKNNVDFFIEHLNLARWFDLGKIVCDNGQIMGKPAPDLYLKAAKNLEVPPENCVVIEDSVSGIQAAYHAKIGHIIGLGPRHTHQKLSQTPGVNQVIENLGEIISSGLFEIVES